MRHFFYDTETGGRTTQTSLLSLYGVITDTNFNPIEDIEFRIRPDDGIYKIEAEGLAVNKIDLIQHDKIAIPVSEAGRKLRDFLSKHTNAGTSKLHPAGWNIYWDNDFVKSQLLPDFESFFFRHCFDVAGIAVLLKTMGRLPPDLKLSLGSLAEHYNVSFLTQAHDAKSDVWTTISVLKCLQNDLSLQNC